MLPPFEPATGNLPPGIHDADWEEIAARLGFTERREQLLGGLLRALCNLRDAGCQVAFIDGSFATAKPEPGDFDGAWDPSGVDIDRLDPVLLNFEPGRKTMKQKYLGEMFLADATAAPGIRFLEFFQQDRDGNPKGIVRLSLGTLP